MSNTIYLVCVDCETSTEMVAAFEERESAVEYANLIKDKVTSATGIPFFHLENEEDGSLFIFKKASVTCIKVMPDITESINDGHDEDGEDNDDDDDDGEPDGPIDPQDDPVDKIPVPISEDEFYSMMDNS